MKPEELTQAVCAYLDDMTDQYAIMITGAWGSGKTHYVENVLRKKLKSKGNSLVRVSLFGVSTPEEFHDRILAPTLALRFGEMVDMGVEAIGSDRAQEAFDKAKDNRSVIKRKLSRVKGAATDLSLIALQAIQKQLDIQLKVATKSVADLLLDENVVLVLDDLERCELNETQMLGLLDTMIEAQGRKVILLANEEQLKKRLSRSDGDAPEEEYLAVKEKLIWRTFSFEPTVNETVQTLFRDRVAMLVDNSKETADEVLGQCANAIRLLGESNLRIVKRGMLICNALQEVNFFADAPCKPTLCSALAGLLELAIFVSREIVMGKEPDMRDDTEDYLEQLTSTSRNARLALVPFLREYLMEGKTSPSEVVFSQVSEFTDAYYPDDELAQKALRAISRWQHRIFRNEEVPNMVIDIENALISPVKGGLSFDRYRDVIEVIDDIQARFPEYLVDQTAIVERMKAAINADLEGAIRSVENEPLRWQEGSDLPNDIQRLSSVDTLREHIRSEALVASAKTLTLSKSEAGIIPFDSLLEVLRNERGATGQSAVLISLEPADAAESLQAYSIEDLHKVHNVLRDYGLRKILLRSAKSSELQEWFRELRMKLEFAESEEIAKNDVLSWIKDDISDLFRFCAYYGR